MGYILDNDVKFLTGVGERRALLLQKELGIRTLGDLLYYFPLHRPQPHLAHRRDRRRFADLYPTPGTHHRFPACRFRAEEAFYRRRCRR